jgi:2-amino-4-hydroxy-6-hydroxymethyldihydropteridine diphosphokinase
MNQVFLSLGSNMGNRRAHLKKAARLLDSDGDSVPNSSPVYETEPWGTTRQRHYYNQVVELATFLKPAELLEKLHRIEFICGRKHTSERYAPRPMDIDILFYEHIILTTETLKIPHPLLHERRFVLVPITDIAPEFVHPVLGKTMNQLLTSCEDEMKVVKIS